MKFTNYTYVTTIRVLRQALQDAWMAFAVTDDLLDYQAFKIILRKLKLVEERYARSRYGAYR